MKAIEVSSVLDLGMPATSKPDDDHNLDNARMQYRIWWIRFLYLKSDCEYPHNSMLVAHQKNYTVGVIGMS